MDGIARPGKPKSKIDIDCLRHIEIYLDADRRVVALDGKTPVEKDWPNLPFRSASELPLRDWQRQNRNFGWVLDDTDVVIDVDMHDQAKNGRASLAQLCRDLALPSLEKLTPAVVETGSGGLHLYFSKPANMAIEKELSAYPGIEFWSKGRQVVGVGSVHPDTGKVYEFGGRGEFDFLTMCELPPLPDALLERVAAGSATRTSKRAGERISTVPDEELIRLRAALSHIDPDVSYNQWLMVLMALHSLENDDEVLSIADAWSALGGKYESDGANSVAAKWSSFHRTALDDRTISVATLYQMAKDAGWSGGVEHVGRYWLGEPPGESGSRHTNDALPITEILKKSFPPLRYIIEGLLPDTGLYILSSNPKAGKTTLVHQACLSLLSNTPFLGVQHDQRRKILFLALEDSERRLKIRTEEILRATEFDFTSDQNALSGLMIKTDWPRPPDGLEALDKWTGENPDTDLIVVDTLAAFRGVQENSSNIYQQDYEMIRSIKRIADRHGICILVLHHNRKAQADDPSAAIGGTYGLVGAADGYMVLSKKGFADAEFVLAAEGREIPPTELALRRNGFVFESLGDAQTYALTPERKEILDLLEFEGAPLAAQQIADKLGRKGPSTRKLLTTMHKRGQLSKVKTGHYSLPEDVNPAA